MRKLRDKEFELFLPVIKWQSYNYNPDNQPSVPVLTTSLYIWFQVKY